MGRYLPGVARSSRHTGPGGTTMDLLSSLYPPRWLHQAGETQQGSKTRVKHTAAAASLQFAVHPAVRHTPVVRQYKVHIFLVSPISFKTPLALEKVRIVVGIFFYAFKAFFSYFFHSFFYQLETASGYSYRCYTKIIKCSPRLAGERAGVQSLALFLLTTDLIVNIPTNHSSKK